MQPFIVCSNIAKLDKANPDTTAKFVLNHGEVERDLLRTANEEGTSMRRDALSRLSKDGEVSHAYSSCVTWTQNNRSVDMTLTGL